MMAVVDELMPDKLERGWIVVNRESVEILVRDYDISRERVAVILNGIEIEQYAFSQAKRDVWRAHWRVGQDELVVGAIGKLTWQKGFEYLIRAWPQVRSTSAAIRTF